MSADRYSPCHCCAKLEPLAFNGPELTKTLREDFRIGIDDCGGFAMWYQASCTECGFEYQTEFSDPDCFPSESVVYATVLDSADRPRPRSLHAG